MIKVIIFDWHGVLDRTTFSNVSSQLSSLSGFSKEKVKHLLGDKKQEFVQGNLSSTDFWSYVAERLNLNKQSLSPIKEYSLTIDLNIALWEMLPLLKKKYELGILSDCPQDKREIIKSNVDLSYFFYVSFSCEDKLSKIAAHDQFFKKAINAFKVNPENILFIDDSAVNINAAKKLGLKGYLFTSTEKFLFDLNVLTA